MKKKIFLLVFMSLVSLIGFSQVLAMEVTYPTIGGVSLPANPTFSNYFLYFFNIALLIGMIAAALVFIFAAINYFFSRGQIGRTEKSKNDIVRALIGLAVLFGSVLIVNAINSGINKNGLDDLHTEQFSGGIMIHYADKDVNLNGNLANATKTANSISWLSSKEELPRIYVFPEKNFQGTPTEVKNGESVMINIGNSITFDWNIPGVYLYDDKEFKLKNIKAPVFLLESRPALGNENFKDKTASIKIVQPERKTASEQLTEYSAVLFEDDNYTGKCSWVMSDLPDIENVNPDNPEENKVRIGETDTFTGIQKVGSIYVLKIDSKVGLSGATLFNGTNCVSVDAVLNPVDNTFKPNTCNVGEYKKEFKFSDGCPDMPQDGDTVVSATITDGSVLILKDKDGNCQLFKKQGISDCVTSITYGIFNMDNRETSKPLYFTLLPGK